MTVGRTTYQLEEPYFVLATQNPLEMEGTYPLPEAQLDRFFFKLMVPFPSRDELHTIIDRTTTDQETKVSRVLTKGDVLGMQKLVPPRAGGAPRAGLRDSTGAGDASGQRRGNGAGQTLRAYRSFTARCAVGAARCQNPRAVRWSLCGVNRRPCASRHYRRCAIASCAASKAKPKA